MTVIRRRRRPSSRLFVFHNAINATRCHSGGPLQYSGTCLLIVNAVANESFDPIHIEIRPRPGLHYRSHSSQLSHFGHTATRIASIVSLEGD